MGGGCELVDGASGLGRPGEEKLTGGLTVGMENDRFREF